MVTIRAAAAGGIVEGDYTSWVWKWTNVPSNGIVGADSCDILIDEKNETLSVAWWDKSYDSRFGIYNLSDFSVVYESSLGSNHLYDFPYMPNKSFITQGMVSFYQGGISQSLQTYLLLSRIDQDIIEVWRSGASALWSRNTQTDFGAASSCYAGGISLTGKYIIVLVIEDSSPYDTYLMLYEGT